MNSLANILSLYEPSSICMNVRKKWHPNPWIIIWDNITQKDNRKEHGRWYTSVKSTINHQATSTTNDKEEKKKLIVHAGCCYRLEGAEWSWCYFRSCCCRKFWSVTASTSHAFSFFWCWRLCWWWGATKTECWWPYWLCLWQYGDGSCASGSGCWPSLLIRHL